MKRLIFGAVVLLMVVACDEAGSDETSTSVPTTRPGEDTTTTQSQGTTTTGALTTTTATGGPALSLLGTTYRIVWASVTDPFWDPNAGSDADPFFFIHTQPAQDGFYFSLEMYTTGYGARWTGELGDVDVICNEAPPAPNSTGICPHFDPDGPGPAPDLNADFAASGSIIINKLDADGYDIVVNEIVFSDGSTIDTFQLVGP